MERLLERVREAPAEPGVYTFYNNEEPLYIGKAVNLRNRLLSHIRDPSTSAGSRLLEETTRLEWTVVPSEIDALILEQQRIRAEQPAYNIALKHSEGFRSIVATMDERFPRVFLTGEVARDDRRYVGPIHHAWGYEALELAGWILQLRTCEGIEPGRPQIPCLDGHLGRCSAPCIGWIDDKAYRERVGVLMTALEGGVDGVRARCEQLMADAAVERHYERAAAWRDRLARWDRLMERRSLPELQLPDAADVIGWFEEDGRVSVWGGCVSDGKLIREMRMAFANATGEEAVVQYLTSRSPKPERAVVAPPLSLPRELRIKRLRDKDLERWAERVARLGARREAAREATEAASLDERRAMEELREQLGMAESPHRIECFDISNLHDAHTVAAMTVLIDGRDARDQMRRFGIQTVTQDDYGALAETLERRVRRWQEGDWPERPELLIIDGGIGQVRAVQEATAPWRELGTAVWGLAKREELLLHADGRMVQLGETSHARRLVQRARDLTHRRAVGFHRLRRDRL